MGAPPQLQFGGTWAVSWKDVAAVSAAGVCGTLSAGQEAKETSVNQWGSGKSRQQLEEEMQGMHNAEVRAPMIAEAPRHGPPPVDRAMRDNKEKVAQQFTTKLIFEANRTRKMCGLGALPPKSEQYLRKVGRALFGLK